MFRGIGLMTLANTVSGDPTIASPSNSNLISKEG